MHEFTKTTETDSQYFYPGQLQRDIESAADHRALYTNGVFVDRFISEVNAIIKHDHIEMLSFDVFDTALLRSPISELGRFQNVSRKMAARIGCEASDLLMARLLGAKASYRNAPAAADGTREGRMDDIAQVVCDLVGAPTETKAYVVTELACERASLRPNPMLKELVDRIGLPRIFVSDMYLSQTQVCKLLGASFGGEPVLFVSTSSNGSKRCGGLFDYVASTVKTAPKRILHFGDSLHSDFQQARRRGWSSFYLPLPKTEVAARRACFDSIAKQLAAIGHDVHSHVAFNM